MRIRRSAVRAIEVHARRDTPRECCGLLIGTADEVIEAVATANVAAEPHRRYQVAPGEHIAQMRRCRETRTRGEAEVGIVGAYHSHPRGAPVPSASDLDDAFGSFLYVIAGPADGSAGLALRAWRLRDGRFEEEALVECA